MARTVYVYSGGAPRPAAKKPAVKKKPAARKRIIEKPARPAPGRAETRRALALAIRALRKRAGVSQEGLAFASGVDRAYVGQIERELRSPTIETLVRLLPPLRITLSRLAAEFDKFLKEMAE